MPLSAEVRRVIRRDRKDWFAVCLRPLLWMASWVYGRAVARRNRRYDQGRAEQHAVDIPVICVGNLTVGGTGKTPMVAYLCRWFRDRGLRVAIVSRGYRADEQGPNDEARELAERLPDVPHIQNPDRVAAVQVAVDELDMQVVVLDDGFQHRRLVRDLDIVLIDALEPFGFDYLLPRGLLREPLTGLRRAHVVALTRANLVSAQERKRLRDRVHAIAPELGWLELAHQPVSLAADDVQEPLENLRGKRVLAFCGLGNPAGFRRTLEDCDAQVVDFLEFPDHHDYTRRDLDTIRERVEQRQPDYAICTHKDMVKIELDRMGTVPLRALLVEQQVLEGQQTLDVLLGRLLPDVADT